MISSFEIGGKTIKVQYLDQDSDNLGRARAPLNVIQLQTKWEGKPIPKSSLELTLYHEFIHCALHEIGRNDLNLDEQLVQSLALLLHQFAKTAKDDGSSLGLEVTIEERKTQ